MPWPEEAGMIATSSARSIFTDGAFGASASGETLSVVDPATGETTGAISAGGAADVDRAVRSAAAAFEGAWGRLAAADRGRVLRRVGEAIADEAERLAAVESADTGKPISQARADVAAAVRYFEFFAGAADKLHGETLPYLPGYAVQVLRVPVGVTGHIIPWNYPTQMFARSLAPSLAAGNATVMKPSEDASQSVIALADVAARAGVPAGAINIVTGLGEVAGDALARHPGVDLIDFIGSPEAGTLVQSAAAQHHARVILELGGKSAQIVFADADLDAAVPAIVRAIVQNGGQTCSAGSRVLIERTAFERVMARIAVAFAALRVGLPAGDPDVGPLINGAQFARVRGFVDRARRDAVPVAAASTLPGDLPAGGYYVAPMVFGPVHERHELARDEVFGPVLSALPFDDEADAVRIANATEYGLVAGVWTENGARQTRVARALRVGQVFVNCYGAGGGVELPFGGFKKSGHGRGKGFAALHEFTTLQTIVQRFA
ncbi:MAG TPA: aldehyde dehydrogenase family protein [Candidatus Elarobacter sp.]|nr:aldehyde dehydrogenase family protein [Candidatus Elarobacter sp.]